MKRSHRDWDVDPAILSMRREALAIGEGDRQLLATVYADVAPSWQPFFERLYERMRCHPELGALLHSDQIVTRLVGRQVEYMASVFGATSDVRHAQMLNALGRVHHRLRITPQWYLATYSHIVCAHVELFATILRDPALVANASTALIKAVLYDMIFVLDAYGEGELEAIRERRAAQVTAESAAGASASSPGRGESVTGSTHAGAGLAPHITLTLEEVQQRRTFLEIEDCDVERLRTLSAGSTPMLAPMLDDFYAFVNSHPETAAMVPPPVVERLKQQVASYWRELFASDFGRPYSSSRMRVGLIHELIGLSLQWYVSGLARQLVRLAHPLLDREAPDVASVKTLVKAVFFDVTFVIDAYMEARAAKLRRLGSFAEDLVTGLSSAVAVIGPDQRILGANAAMLELVAGKPALVYRMPISTALPIPALESLLARVLRQSRPRATAAVRFAGRRMQVTATRLSPSPDIPAGGCALVLDDVSELQQIEERVQSGEQQLAQVLATVDAVAWQMDRQSQSILAISEAVIHLTGYRDMYFVGRPSAWFEAIAPADRGRFRQRLDALSNGGEITMEHRMRHADGTERWACSRVTARHSPLGADVWYGVTIDISQSKRAEARRLEAIGLLASSIAHYLNNALMGISGSVELHAQSTGGIARHPHLQRVIEEVREAGNVTRQLLAFAAKQDLRPRATDCNRVVRELGAELRQTYGSTLQLSVAVEPELWPTLVDPDRLRVALRCLAENSAESAPAPVALTISTRNVPMQDAGDERIAPRGDADWIEVSLADRGAGMTEDVRERALEPFFTTKSPEEGHYGLGLSMAYGFATQSGGYLGLISQPPVGTTVTLRFPRLVESPLPVHAAMSSSTRVLVVDDSAFVLDVVASMLESTGVSVVRAPTASAALERLLSEAVDILLSDVRLGPGPDGIELARAAEKIRPGIRIVLMSGYTGRELGLELMPEHFSFLQKPFSAEELAAAIGPNSPRDTK